jgi:heme-degrading monooxygenase HmoA
MVHVMIRHKVADYVRWKEAFDSHLTNRKRAGETGCQVFHSVEDPREIFVLLDWQTVEEARKFMNSDDLRQRMKDAGVQGTPDVQYLEDARAVHRSAAD